MAEETKPQTAQELMALIAAAGASGDLAEVIRLGNILRKQKSDIEKAEADKLQKESEELAGARDTMAKNLAKLILPQIKATDLLGLKVKSFVVTVSHKENDKGQIDPEGAVKVTGGVALVVPQIKTRKAGGGGGPRESTKDQVGMSLSELIETYATQEQKVGIQAAYDKAEKNKGSAKWQEQVRVKADILKAHPELIRK